MWLIVGGRLLCADRTVVLSVSNEEEVGVVKSYRTVMVIRSTHVAVMVKLRVGCTFLLQLSFSSLLEVVNRLTIVLFR